MSQVKVQGDPSGTGTFTIAAPNSNNTRTLTLPDATGTLTTTTDANLTTLSAASASDMSGVNTTATVTSGTASMTVGSATGITAGMVVVAQGITPGTTVSTIVSTTVTLSANANATLSSAPVTFYTPAKVVTPASIGGQLCRAWVNFNGQGTVAIRASFNVTSITDNGTGDYTVNFTTAMQDANYSIKGSSCTNLGVRQVGFVHINCTGTTEVAPTTSACRIYTSDTSLTGVDFKYVSVAIFR